MNDIEDGRLRAHVDGELTDQARDEVTALLLRSAATRARADQVMAVGHRVDRMLRLPVEPPDAEAAWRRVAEATAPRRGWGWPLALAAMAAGLLLFSLAFGRGSTIEGEATVTQRQTIGLASRAVAVAESGAALAWRIRPDGRTRVTQTAGVVFYRVNPGSMFEVQTPAGLVAVTGTCFSVELRPMKNTLSHLGSAAAGAVVATAIVLTVHEGSVTLASEGDAIEVQAGQRAQAQAGRAPGLMPQTAPSDAAAHPQALARLRAENEALRAAARDAQAAAPDAAADPDPQATDPMAAVRRCANSMGLEGCNSFEPEPEVLAERARCGTLAMDTPGFLFREGYDLEDDLAELVDLSDAEREVIGEVNERFATEHAAALSQLVEQHDLAQGKAARAQLLQDTPPWATIRALSSVIEGATREDGSEARAAVARQLAGLEPAPSDLGGLSMAQHYVQLQAGLGDAYERALAQALSPARARELRVADNGWSSKTLYGGECPEPGDED